MAGGGSGTGSKRLMRPDRYSILIFDELSIVSSRGTDGRGVDVDIVGQPIGDVVRRLFGQLMLNPYFSD